MASGFRLVLLAITAVPPKSNATNANTPNGNQLITEKTCKQNYEVKGTDCEHEKLSWVTETENWLPGILQLEVIATDNEGHISSERFADNVPYVPPPDPVDQGKATHVLLSY
jgi:glucan biosynthesis protein